LASDVRLGNIMVQVKGIIRCAVVDFQGFHHRAGKESSLVNQMGKKAVLQVSQCIAFRN